MDQMRKSRRLPEEIAADKSNKHQKYNEQDNVYNESAGRQFTAVAVQFNGHD